MRRPRLGQHRVTRGTRWHWQWAPSRHTGQQSGGGAGGPVRIVAHATRKASTALLCRRSLTIRRVVFGFCLESKKRAEDRQAFNVAQLWYGVCGVWCVVCMQQAPAQARRAHTPRGKRRDGGPRQLDPDFPPLFWRLHSPTSLQHPAPAPSTPAGKSTWRPDTKLKAPARKVNCWSPSNSIHGPEMQ